MRMEMVMTLLWPPLQKQQRNCVGKGSDVCLLCCCFVSSFVSISFPLSYRVDSNFVVAKLCHIVQCGPVVRTIVLSIEI